jgi:uncharacterized protein YndB with AHSA1/START domain
MSDLYGVLTRGDAGHTATFEREYETTAADLWSAITEPGRISRWMARVEGDLRPGGRVAVRFDDGDATFDIDVCEPPKTLVVHWIDGDRHTVVRADVHPLGDDRSRLVLAHERLTASSAPQYATGWHYHLDTLAGELSGQPVDRTEWEELAAEYATRQNRAGSR